MFTVPQRMRVNNCVGRTPSLLLSEKAESIFSRFMRRYRGRAHPQCKFAVIGYLLRHKYPCFAAVPVWPTQSINRR
jgi:hypothetical protein